VAATGNAEESKARILHAAMAEFAAYGIAGARVERIAKTVGCNKNLLYIYFGNKENLFNTVLERNLGRVYDEIPFPPDDLPGYAGQVFDFGIEHPDVLRLLLWSVLEQSPGSSLLRRSAQDAKVAALAEVQAKSKAGNRFPPEFLLTVTMAVANAWSAVGPFGGTLNPDAAKDLAGIRERVVAAVELLVSARK
jgi:AcrR family transcriptional regulator